jgi:hypothetical protein
MAISRTQSPAIVGENFTTAMNSHASTSSRSFTRLPDNLSNHQIPNGPESTTQHHPYSTQGIQATNSLNCSVNDVHSSGPRRPRPLQVGTPADTGVHAYVNDGRGHVYRTRPSTVLVSTSPPASQSNLTGQTSHTRTHQVLDSSPSPAAPPQNHITPHGTRPCTSTAQRSGSPSFPRRAPQNVASPPNVLPPRREYPPLGASAFRRGYFTGESAEFK